MNTQTQNHAAPFGRAFTLVELLVVVAIIALLLAILLPSLNKARDQAKAVVCLSHLKEIGSASALYSYDNNDCIVAAQERTQRAHQILMPYLGMNPNTYFQGGATAWPFTIPRPRGVYACPMSVDTADVDDPSDYGKNILISRQTWTSSGNHLAFPYIRTTQVQKPALTFMFMDSDWREVWWVSRDSAAGLRHDRAAASRTSDNGQEEGWLNTSYQDGHAAMIYKNQMQWFVVNPEPWAAYAPPPTPTVYTP